MADVSFHRVTTVKEERVHFKNEPEFYTTTLTIIDEDGNDSTVKLFSNKPISYIDNTYEEIG